MTNKEIKNEIQRHGLKQWEVAQAAGIGEYTLIRWFRKEMTAPQKEQLLSALNQLVKERGE